MEIGTEYLAIQRTATENFVADPEELPEDIDESGPVP
jgi:hypothetical protein